MEKGREFYNRFLTRGIPVNTKDNGSDWIYGTLEIIEIMPSPIDIGRGAEEQNLYRINTRAKNSVADWGMAFSQEHIFVEYDSIGRYTQKDDINGVKIFEGDIVKFERNGYFYTGIVYFREKLLQWCVEDIYSYIEDLYSARQLEVIGNIYESKDKLKEFKGLKELKGVVK